jgi:nucleoside-diphosphate-sugar epimerase
MRILVTGAGIIGAHTARVLHAAGHDVRLLDVAPNLTAVRSIVDLDAIPLLKADVTDSDALQALLQSNRIERVVHTAALMTAACRADPRLGLHVNVFGTTTVLDCARRGLVDRVVLSSSNVVEAPSTSVYALSKMLSEQVTNMYRDSYGVKALSLRYGAVFGTWSGAATSLPARLMRVLVEAAVAGKPAVINDPLLTWQGVDSFVDARDCAEANAAAVLAEAPVTAIYDIAPGKGLAFDEIVAAIKERFPKFEVDHQVKTQTGFAGYPVKHAVTVDNGPAAKELGFTPRYSIGATVDEAIRFISSAGALAAPKGPRN